MNWFGITQQLLSLNWFNQLRKIGYSPPKAPEVFEDKKIEATYNLQVSIESLKERKTRWVEWIPV